MHGTKSDVRRALEEYRRELESGFANPDKVTAPELGWRWHEQRKLLKNLSPLTHKTDECELKKAERWFAGVLVSDLSLLNMVYAGLATPIWTIPGGTAPPPLNSTGDM